MHTNVIAYHFGIQMFHHNQNTELLVLLQLVLANLDNNMHYGKVYSIKHLLALGQLQLLHNNQAESKDLLHF